MNEASIRDLLIKQLGIIEPGLTLIEKEKYLPSTIGTSSFIDILAKDSLGRFVIIELKRSNVSARQAIHELFKYLEAIKEHISLKKDEIRLIIVSTEWEELIVPFSSLSQKIDVEGFKLTLPIKGILLSANRINPVPMIEDRMISLIQMARYYHNKTSLSKGILSHEEFFKSHEIEDYVLIVLKAPPNYIENVKNSIKQSLNIMKSKSEFKDIETDDKFKKIEQLDGYEFMIYSGNSLLTIERYIAVLKKLCEYPESIQEVLDNNEATKLDTLEQLNELLIQCAPFPKADFVEIGTPAKYEHFINDQKWEVVEIKRYGRLADNELLTNETIEREIKGSAGTSGQKYNSTIDFKSKSNVNRVTSEIENCLSDNLIWKNHILNILKDLAKEKMIVQCNCSIYNPMNIIYTIHLATTKDQGILYLPFYQIKVDLKDEERYYVGYLGESPSGEISLEKIFEQFYKKNSGAFFYSLTWGGYNPENVQMCKFIGLQYKTMLIIKKKDKLDFFKYEDYTFVPSAKLTPLDEIDTFIEENQKLCDDINELFDENMLGNGIFKF